MGPVTRLRHVASSSLATAARARTAAAAAAALGVLAALESHRRGVARLGVCDGLGVPRHVALAHELDQAGRADAVAHELA